MFRNGVKLDGGETEAGFRELHSHAADKASFAPEMCATDGDADCYASRSRRATVKLCQVAPIKPLL